MPDSILWQLISVFYFLRVIVNIFLLHLVISYLSETNHSFHMPESSLNINESHQSSYVCSKNINYEMDLFEKCV